MVSSVLEQFQHCNQALLEQLQLDLYELGKFAAFGFENNMVQWRGQMATSLHSCGNQLMGCPCGCRKYPFTEQRLQSGGLHGLLIPLLGESRCGNNIYPNFRHISPDELALLNGMYPGCDWGPQSRMALCALGQLASPLQSAWIGAAVMKHIQTFLEVEESCQPERVLLNMMANLLKARDETFGEPNSVECRRFQQMISQKSFTGIPSSVGVVPSVPAANAQVEANPTFGESQKPQQPLRPQEIHQPSVHASEQSCKPDQASEAGIGSQMPNLPNQSNSELPLHERPADKNDQANPSQGISAMHASEAGLLSNMYRSSHTSFEAGSVHYVQKSAEAGVGSVSHVPSSIPEFSKDLNLMKPKPNQVAQNHQHPRHQASEAGGFHRDLKLEKGAIPGAGLFPTSRKPKCLPSTVASTADPKPPDGSQNIQTSSEVGWNTDPNTAQASHESRPSVKVAEAGTISNMYMPTRLPHEAGSYHSVQIPFGDQSASEAGAVPAEPCPRSRQFMFFPPIHMHPRLG